MECSKREIVIGMLILITLLISSSVIITIDQKDSQYCEKHGGKWSRGLCFSDAILVEVD